MAKKYRVKSKCLDCGRRWKTKAKDKPTSPRMCGGENGCGSWSVEKQDNEPLEVVHV